MPRYSPESRLALEFVAGAQCNVYPKKLLNMSTGKVEYGVEQNYAILSYVWTEWNEQREQLLETIKRPLRDARLGYIWIDYWCIDQSDMAEKSEEVAKMSTYYRNAALGIVSIPNWRSGDISTGVNNSLWARRVWTLQEAACMRTALIVGSGKIGTHQEYFAKRYPTGPSLGVPFGKCSREGTTLYDSFDEIWSTNQRQCGNSKDLILGYLGLVKGADRMRGRYECQLVQLLGEAAQLRLLSTCIVQGEPGNFPDMGWAPKIHWKERIGGEKDFSIRMTHYDTELWKRPLCLTRGGAVVNAERGTIKFIQGVDRRGQAVTICEVLGRNANYVYSGTYDLGYGDLPCWDCPYDVLFFHTEEGMCIGLVGIYRGNGKFQRQTLVAFQDSLGPQKKNLRGYII